MQQTPLTPQPLPRLMNVADLARLTQLSPNQIRMLARRGLLPAIDFGVAGRHLWRFHPDAIAEVLKTGGRLGGGK